MPTAISNPARLTISLTYAIQGRAASADAEVEINTITTLEAAILGTD